ncbi:MAG: hypothetical protein K2O49_06715, partial [Muribaculaceae bacterium]|nr:hypothetical protein [Muribaculaceae bacterium]
EYYRPENIKDWRTDIHHITPEMVADKPHFRDRKEKVEKLLGEAYALTGFALGNDIRVLSRSDVEGLEDMKVLDVKDMYWYMRGREEGLSPFSIPSLLVCANNLGLDFTAEEAHSASADTEATLRCFNLLWKEFVEKEGAGLTDEETVEKFHASIDEERGKFIEESAKGYVKVMKNGPYHKLKFGRLQEPEKSGMLFDVEVADRFKAEYELRKSLKKKEVPGKTGAYRLGPKQLEEIRKYKNTYNAEDSAWCKKILKGMGLFSF